MEEAFKGKQNASILQDYTSELKNYTSDIRVLALRLSVSDARDSRSPVMRSSWTREHTELAVSNSVSCDSVSSWTREDIPVRDMWGVLHQGCNHASKGEQTLVDVPCFPCPLVHSSRPTNVLTARQVNLNSHGWTQLERMTLEQKTPPLGPDNHFSQSSFATVENVTTRDTLKA
ncbi:hypothetical protein MAR_015921 [Mya arenaria]|uniref:Uncharacterized protein n=1 Tax=Mya arenaria TaxID=6604 RepID=A0ABY7FK48_MYAAR|nr:hypothetical protein MAR_015921 [Mya arenaria]